MENNVLKKEEKQSKYLIVRILFLLLGVISLVLGTIGIILPILPTVPLYLLTSYCFMKASKKFNDWFISTKLYVKYVSGFAEHKAMSITGQLLLLSLVSIMLIFAMWKVSVLPMTITLNILLVIKYSYFIANVKTVSKKELTQIKETTKMKEVTV